MRTRILTVLFVVVFICSVSCINAAQYRLTNLGTLPSGYSMHATGINDKGCVVGYSANGGFSREGWQWSNGTFTTLGVMPGCSVTGGYAINNSSQIAANSFVDTASPKAFVFQNSTRTPVVVSGFDYCCANDINDYGDVVGYTVYGGLSYRSYLWNNGTVTQLGSLGGRTQAYGINNKRQVVGDSSLPSGSESNAFMWQDGIMTNLGRLPGGNVSKAYAINELGDIVGYSRVNDYLRAVLWHNGAISELGTQAGGNSIAYDINDNGQIVGHQVKNGNWSAFVCEDGVVRDLSNMVTSQGWIIYDAKGINETGCIVADAFYGSYGGQSYAVLLTPVPEPHSIISLLFGLGGIGGFAACRKRQR